MENKVLDAHNHHNYDTFLNKAAQHWHKGAMRR